MTGSTVQRGLFLSALSGFLLTLAFPRWGLWWLAWVALVPLLHSIEKSSTWKEAFLLGLTAGFTFFLLSVSWLRHVTVFGMIFVVLMEATYWGVFAAVAKGRNGGVLFLAACWVVLEFIRAELPVWGFGWNLLGASQTANLWIAQLASLGGAYSLSFLVFLGNQVAHLLFQKGIKGAFQNVLLFSSLIAAVGVFGWSRIQAFNSQSFLQISVLQGNIPQALKWDASYKRQILRVYLNLTELASFDKPQMIVWPEAAYPGFFNQESLAERIKERVRKIKIPTLLGSPHAEIGKYYNSAYLLNSSGEIAGRYDKIRLVPFGEYVPWKVIFGFLERFAYALGVSDFSPGRELKVFRLGESGPKFSTLICFEDTFPNLARKFVDRDADFLVVITNDAWFGHSSAPYQHLQASQLRAIENGVSVVRSANTGVSGFITPWGQVTERVRNQENKDTFIIGGMTYPVTLSKEETLYRKGGWLFPYVCLMVLVLGLFLPRRVVSAVFLAFFLSGCIHFQGGAFYAKKGSNEKPPEVKEISVNTDKLLGRDTGSRGKIEV